MKTKRKKLFVLDTNVILYDHTCILNFQEHDIVIPIVVLEELDSFKKGSDLINFQAREFIRELDKISGDKLFTDGISLGKNRGRIFVKIGENNVKEIQKIFIDNNPDHKILSLTFELNKKKTDRQVILVTKDVNLRMKAKSVGLAAEDYETGKIRNIDEYTSRPHIFENFDKNIINKFYQEPYLVNEKNIKMEVKPNPNEGFILKNQSSSVLVRYNKPAKSFEKVIKNIVYGIEPRNAEQTFAIDALLNPDIKLVGITGKAGTGKTLLALASALQLRKSYQQIYLARPVIPLSNKDLGFLPGDIKSKLDPYMQPLFDNLNVIKNKYSTESPEYKRLLEMIAQEKLYIAPLAYIRGRSLEKVFFIVDEAQNLTPHEIKTIITRAGEGTKMVFTGDICQIDTPYLDSQSNGLSYLVDRMKGQDIFSHVNLIRGERSQLAELATNLL